MYPSPYKISNSSTSIYCFKYTDPITKKRVLKSSGCMKKTDAAAFIREFIDGQPTDEYMTADSVIQTMIHWTDIEDIFDIPEDPLNI